MCAAVKLRAPSFSLSCQAFQAPFDLTKALGTYIRGSFTWHGQLTLIFHGTEICQAKKSFAVGPKTVPQSSFNSTERDLQQRLIAREVHGRKLLSSKLCFKQPPFRFSLRLWPHRPL